MDRRTVLAIVLSVAIVGVGVFVTQSFFGPKEQTQSVVPNPNTSPAIAQSPAPSATPAEASVSAADTGTGVANPALAADAIVPVALDQTRTDAIVYDNNTIRVEIDPKGANIRSFKLLKYDDHKVPVEMIMPGESAGLVTQFFGRAETIGNATFVEKFSSNANIKEFYRDFYINSDPSRTFRVTKKYTFYPEDYLFLLDVTVDAGTQYNPINSNGSAYSLKLGPQIGPLSSKMGTTQDFRRMIYLVGSDRKTSAPAVNSAEQIKDRISWAAIDSKYFSFFIIPGSADFRTSFKTTDFTYAYEKNGPVTIHNGAELVLERPEIQASRNTDTYRIYAGPKLYQYLSKYNKPEDNPAGQTNLNLEKIVDTNILTWLEDGMKAIMQLFYSIPFIQNWGVAIILLTILIKVVLYPLSLGSMKSMARMQTLTPKINELREKYKENPQKMNLEMAELYRKEKINPLGGCLPLLLQFPFFFAMYGLFANHFDLREAVFIPGWINDLSVPETVVHFNISLPLIGQVTGLHILPFLYLASQFLTTKFTQTTTTAQSGAQMKIFMYVLPSIFFFVLYETPSGLLVYWIFQNVLSIGQQILVNKQIARHNAAAAAQQTKGNKIVPKKNPPNKPKSK